MAANVGRADAGIKMGCGSREPLPAKNGYFSMEERPTEKSATEARQAVRVWPMKFVLGIGTAGAVLALLLAWLYLR